MQNDFFAKQETDNNRETKGRQTEIYWKFNSGEESIYYDDVERKLNSIREHEIQQGTWLIKLNSTADTSNFY